MLLMVKDSELTFSVSQHGWTLRLAVLNVKGAREHAVHVNRVQESIFGSKGEEIR